MRAERVSSSDLCTVRAGRVEASKYRLMLLPKKKRPTKKKYIRFKSSDAVHGFAPPGQVVGASCLPPRRLAFLGSETARSDTGTFTGTLVRTGEAGWVTVGKASVRESRSRPVFQAKVSKSELS